MGASKGGAKFPLVLSERGVSVTIYRSEQRKSERSYVSFWLVWHGPDGRCRRSFASIEEAKTEAGRVLGDIISGRAASETVTRDDAVLLNEASRIAGEMKRPLLALLAELRAAEQILEGEVSIAEAARFWKRHCGRLTPRLVSDAAKAFFAEKESAKLALSPSYLKDIRLRLGKFVKEAPYHVHEIDRAAIRAWLDRSGRSHIDRRKKYDAVKTFLRWCAERDYISADAAADALRIEKQKKRTSKAVEIYSPTELRRILFGCETAGPIRADLVPFVTLGAFAGIRPDGEFQRIEWSDIRQAEGFIEIRAAKAKTGNRRLIPINDTLAAWLAPYANRKGRVAPFKKLSNALRRRCKDVGVPFRKNALRHCYGSYRTATLKNVNEVALEMGNSAAMIFRHYRELVTPACAEEWWAIAPKAAKVVSIAG